MRHTHHSSRPRGFTLVELLVVMTIIGILMAIMVPAVYYARIAAMNASITFELSKLGDGVEQYKNSFGDYPPNFDNQALLRRHLSKRQRIASNQITTFDTFVQGQNAYIDPAEALVFWLGGDFHPKPDGTPTNGSLHNNPVVPLQVGATRAGEPKLFFEFNTARLTDNDGDGWLEYSAPGTNGSPYVYFENRSYSTYLSNPFDVGSGRGKTSPLGSPTPANSFQMPTSFQIISAGLDGLYGDGSAQMFPTGPFQNNDRDNLANFSEGKTFLDSVP